MEKIYSRYFRNGDFIKLFNENCESISYKHFSLAEEYNGGILVKEKGNKGCYYYVDNYGRFSEPFEEASLPIEGTSIVQLPKNSRDKSIEEGPRIRYKDGSLSEIFVDLKQCADGAIISQKDYGSKKRLYDINGKISDEYDYISPSSLAGARVISDNKKKSYKIRYRDGSIVKDSDRNDKTFFSLTDFDSNGFAKCMHITNSNQYKTMCVDLLGRLSTDYTQSGYDFAQFLQGKIKIEHMDFMNFEDDEFCRVILAEFAKKYKQKVQEDYAKGTTYSKAQVEKWMSDIEKIIDNKKLQIKKQPVDIDNLNEYFDKYL